MSIKRALLSVSDKEGILDFAKGLISLGYEIVSTGGTEKALKAAGLSVINISDVTGFPECLDGRVKTLHPAVHAGILAMRGNAEHMQQIERLGIAAIDVVAVNLYPFKKTVENEDVELAEAIENIDIGGPTMIRAAAKNYQDVAVVVDPADYKTVLDELSAGGVTRETHFRLCYKVFAHTGAYDALISSYLAKKCGIEFPDTLNLTFNKAQPLRYGENPHQNAVFYKEPFEVKGSITAATQLWGKELSYNNIADADGALNLLREFDGEPTVVAVKHSNPCGVASAKSISEAFKRAHDADPVSIFGGIIACNREVDLATAEQISKIFIEIVIAPGFEKNALELLKKKANIRLMCLPSINARLSKTVFEMKKVVGGLLVQERDLEFWERLEYVTSKKPTKAQEEDLAFAMKICKHTKSNSIVVVKDKQTIGVGTGQTNRIWASIQALTNVTQPTKGAVMASDAFFPFPDCVEEAAKHEIAAIVHPGGSKNDPASIEAAEKAGIAMAISGLRHFKH